MRRREALEAEVEEPVDRSIRVDGDRWKVRLSDRPPRPGTRAVIFFCETSDQRPFRVVEVPVDRVDGAGGLAALSESELRQLYRESGSLGFPQSYP